MNAETQQITVDARSDEAKQQEAIGLIIKCLMAVGVSNGMNDQFNRDLWQVAELFGISISKMDLLRLVRK